MALVYPDYGAGEKEEAWTWQRFAVLGGVIVGLLVALYFLLPYLNEEEITGEAIGTIYITAEPFDGSYPLTIHTLKEAGGGLEPLVFAGINITPTFDEIGQMIFASFADDEESMELFLNKDETKEEYWQLTDDDIAFKREPVMLQSDTRVAYIATDNADPSVPEDWDIYILDTETGTSTLYASGTNPTFAPDKQSFLYLRSDGLYRYSFADDSSELVFEAEVAEYENLDLSHDGTRLAWSDHVIDGLAFFSISSWEPFTMELEERYLLNALDGVFSPDDRYYASYVYQFDEELNISGAKLWRYDMAQFEDTGEIEGEEMADLSIYGLDYVWISAWR